MKRSLLAQIKQQVADNYSTVRAICDVDRKKRLKYYNENESPKNVGPIEAKRIRDKRKNITFSEDPRVIGSNPF